MTDKPIIVYGGLEEELKKRKPPKDTPIGEQPDAITID